MALESQISGSTTQTVSILLHFYIWIKAQCFCPVQSPQTIVHHFLAHEDSVQRWYLKALQCMNQVGFKKRMLSREGERKWADILTFLQHCLLTDLGFDNKVEVNMPISVTRKLFLREPVVVTVVQELAIPTPLSLTLTGAGKKMASCLTGRVQNSKHDPGLVLWEWELLLKSFWAEIAHLDATKEQQG